MTSIALVHVVVDADEIVATAGHPFWVVDGQDLQSRPQPKQLAVGEDAGQALPGRWVDSHDLLPGDVIQCLDGRRRVVEQITLRQVQGVPVANLTVESNHTFAVGECGILVHNRGWCDILEKTAMVMKPPELIKKAQELGLRIHAHHIVQQTLPKKLLYALVKDLNVHVSWPKYLQQSWYIGQSQDILKKFGVPLLDDIHDAARRAANRETLHNLTWAFNGNGTHSTASAKAVWEALSTATSRADVEEILLRFGRTLMQGKTLF